MANTPLGSSILVPFDGSPLSAQAFPLASGLVAPGGKITVLAVRRDANEPDGGAHRELNDIAAAMTKRLGDNVTVQVELRDGDVERAIVAAANESNADLIVMSSRGQGGLRRLVLGSTTRDVLNSAEQSVAIIHGQREQFDSANEEAAAEPLRFRRIILPIDGSETSLSAVSVVKDLAGRLSLGVLVISTVDLVQTTSPGVIQDVGFSINVEAMYEQTREVAREWLAQVQNDLQAAGIAAETDFRTGRPATAIAEIAQAGDLIAMATSGKGGLERALTGSVSDELIQSGVAPVLICRA